MALPKAHICHASKHRVRIKIPSRRKDAAYFSRVEACFDQAFKEGSIIANPLTAGFLILGEDIQGEKIAHIGRTDSLFDLTVKKGKKLPPSKPVATSLGLINRKIQTASQGRFDLWEALFIGLLGFGVVEIIRGNFKTPPWYTAFWYAFGIYTKSIIDKTTTTDTMDDIP